MTADRPLERIIVIGNTGSGKSTLAEELARRLGLPFIELDALFWLPNWTEPQPEDFREKVRAAIEGGRWVIAGNYAGRTQDITWPLAQVVVRLDLGLARSLVRVTRRSWQRSRSTELLWGTNTETFAKHLKLWSQDSLLHWAVKAHFTHRIRALEERADPRWAHISFVRLRSPHEVARWTEAVAPTHRGAFVSARPASRLHSYSFMSRRAVPTSAPTLPSPLTLSLSKGEPDARGSAGSSHPRLRGGAVHSQATS